MPGGRLKASWERGPEGSLRSSGSDGGAMATVHKAMAYLHPAPSLAVGWGGQGHQGSWGAACPAFGAQCPGRLGLPPGLPLNHGCWAKENRVLFHKRGSGVQKCPAPSKWVLSQVSALSVSWWPVDPVAVEELGSVWPGSLGALCAAGVTAGPGRTYHLNQRPQAKVPKLGPSLVEGVVPTQTGPEPPTQPAEQGSWQAG